ncbi:MAG: hypothetical protein ACLFTK_06845 [Anaerolineales bacterium]
MNNGQQHYERSSTMTRISLQKIAEAPHVREHSELSLPEIENVVQTVARMVPAGNVPGMILSGLTRLNGRKQSANHVQRDIAALFQGVEQTLDRAVYGAFFAGPAAIIWGYQQLLRLAGKHPDDAFPEGLWQFYVDYALREDSARHTNETHGFDTVLRRYNVQLNRADRITAWVMAAIHISHSYDDLLGNEWRERVYLRLLREVTADDPQSAAYFDGLYKHWERHRPYARPDDSTTAQSFVEHRREVFEAFLENAIRDRLTGDQLHTWLNAVQEAEAQALPAYQRQMSSLAFLEPGIYGEQRHALPKPKTHIGVIVEGVYYLVPAFDPQSLQPLDLTSVRTQIATLLAYPAEREPATLCDLVRVPRSDLNAVLGRLRPELADELELLRLTPIILNTDASPANQPLTSIRQGERGLGGHALTVFDTGTSFVFDLSHIFFDGIGGASIAEIFTNEALFWAAQLHDMPPAEVGRKRPYALRASFEAAEYDLIAAAPRVPPEVSAENRDVNLKKLLLLRRLMRKRSRDLHLTVNDLLVLYRAVHANTYQAHPYLASALQKLASSEAMRGVAMTALEAVVVAGQDNPAILIPLDASAYDPRDRVYPLSFHAPVHDLNLLQLHAETLTALHAYQSAGGSERGNLYYAFEELQQTYLATLAGFGVVLARARQIAQQKEDTSAQTIKLLAHMPTPFQRLLDTIPGRFDVLNDIIKGREVFSNVGQVVPGSTLRRFTTAKDDNHKKTLGWGVLTDADGVMCITLRDFRPHVAALLDAGRADLAGWIVQDYLDSYVAGLNAFVDDLYQIAGMMRETQPTHPTL